MKSDIIRYGERNKTNDIFTRSVFMFLIGIVCLTISSGCSSDSNNSELNQSKIDMAEINWNLLCEKRIFFGHQSVGNGILKGIDSLQVNLADRINIVDTRSAEEINGPILAHTKVGRNLCPESKIDDFVKIIENGVGNKVDIVMLKLCYVDLNTNSNPEAIFSNYKSSIERLSLQFPGIKVLHWTVPLTEKPRGIKGIVKSILRMDDNPYRHEYNELIRSTFNPDDIFDIALIQSTYPDGRRNLYRGEIPGLVPEYSSDGGHLNDYGKEYVATKLLLKLQSIQ